MRQAASSQPLKVLVVTNDRALQRQWTHVLGKAGYDVLQAAEPHLALAAVQAEAPAIVVIDAEIADRNEWEICRLLTQHQTTPAQFRLLLIDQPDENQLQEALEAGIDDFLPKPVSFGELLARLRAAARVLEYDRRAEQQDPRDARTDLLSRSAFIRRLRKQLIEQAGSASRAACVVLDVDFFSRINRLQSMAVGDTLLQTIARELNNLRNGSAILGSLGGNRFCAILPGATDVAAVEWAEHVRQVLAATKFELGETTCEITASFGVTACLSGETAEEILDHATQALQTAKSSGRNCVVRFGEFGGDSREILQPGKLLEQTIARDVMTPCTVFLQAAEPLAEAIDLFHRTRLEAIPVVDGDGKLVGLCEQSRVLVVDESECATRTVGDEMTTEVKSFGQQEKLATLLDFFNRDQRSMALITHEGRPLGFVTCNCLVALSRPVTSANLSAGMKYCDTSDYLLVPDLRPLENTPSA